MADVRINGIRAVDNALPRMSGDSLVAIFDCQVAGIQIRECRLFRSEDGERHHIRGATRKTRKGDWEALVTFHGEELRRGIAAKALAALAAVCA